MTEQRDAMAARWIEWIGDRIARTPSASIEATHAEFHLILDTFAALIGPLRREVKPLWTRITTGYGRHAATRGLAAGEVVEEMQYLRELLIRYLAPAIAALRPRQGMALLLRLNRLVDRGVAMAVVGYTDAMVATLLPRSDDDAEAAVVTTDSILEHLDRLRVDLDQIVAASARA